MVGCCMQAEYHGFGLTVKPSKLFPVNGKAVQDAVQHVLHTPAFKVKQPTPFLATCM